MFYRIDQSSVVLNEVDKFNVTNQCEQRSMNAQIVVAKVVGYFRAEMAKKFIDRHDSNKARGQFRRSQTS